MAAATQPVASAQTLEGFRYGKEQAPSGKEWEDPQQQALNKEQPHAWFFSFTDTESAAKVLPENSRLWMSLNGTWKFNWVGNPSERPADFFRKDYDTSSWDDIEVPSNWNIEGIGKDGSLKYGVPIYVNVNEPFKLEIKPGDWKNGVMRTPPSDWTMYKDRNEVGSYKRTFEIPEAWAGKEVFLNFDGVDSFFYLWVNGSYVGFSKNSRNVASFNITEYLTEGKNEVAVEVYRNSDGSFLECQDMFRLPGIFRTVALEAKPKTHVRDIMITPGFAGTQRKDGTLCIALDVVGAPEGCTASYTIYANKLYSEECSPVATFEDKGLNACLKVADIKPWSAEEPNRYTIVGELKDASGKTLDIFSSTTGFRDISIHYGSASENEYSKGGRYFYVNGKTIKLKGVNRHESDPSTGHVMSRESMQEDLFLMKRANINHVRDCHYPDDPYWYHLCDKYGIYLMDEANIESHEYRYDEASLSHDEAWKAAHVARMTEMVRQNFNHPSIIIWSMGNEAGPGQNFQATYDAARAIDPTRPIQYERNNNISDIGCSQYPSIEWVRKAVKGTQVIKYPYHVNEYSHSMGNAMGNFEDYWEAFESSDFFMGGAIWDWVDQALYYYTEDGTRYLAYGGDFGDKPNDGEFEMNGVIFADREPKPQYFEVKKVHQYVKTTFADDKVKAFNKNYFQNATYEMAWTVTADGKAIASGSTTLKEIAPRSAVEYPIPQVDLPEGKECLLNIAYSLTSDLPWAEAGYVVAQDQFTLQAGVAPALAPQKGKVSIDGNIIRGKGFELEFDFAKGTIHKLAYGKKTVIPEGCGPVLNPLRAFVNNDNWIYETWYRNGLNDLRTTAGEPVIEKTGETVTITQKLVMQAPCASKIEGGWASGHNTVKEMQDVHDVIRFDIVQKWTVDAAGRILLESEISSDRPQAVLGRIGYMMKLDKSLDGLSYYGHGPAENYSDRCAGSPVGIYRSTVAEQVTNYPRPQEMGNHEGVRWMSLTGKDRKGIKVSAMGNSCCEGTPALSMQAIPYSVQDLVMSPHGYQLPESEHVHLNVDAKVTGLGGNSCGQGGPLEEDRAKADNVRMSFIIEPVR